MDFVEKQKTERPSPGGQKAEIKVAGREMHIPDFGRGPCKRAENRVPRPVQNAPAARKQKTEAAQRVTRGGPKTRKQKQNPKTPSEGAPPLRRNQHQYGFC